MCPSCSDYRLGQTRPGELSVREGLVGDNWQSRPSARTADGSPHPDMQLNIMNTRVAALLAQTKRRWSLAGDQLFIDLDLSAKNVPPGTRLALGTAVIELRAGLWPRVAAGGESPRGFRCQSIPRDRGFAGVRISRHGRGPETR